MAADEAAADDGYRIVERAPITIPLRALSEGVTSGVVQLALLIDAEGKLSDALASFALDPIERWRFEPPI